MRKVLRAFPTLYFAAPLFSAAELSFNLSIARRLDQHFDVYLPQRDGGLLVDLVSRGVGVAAAYQSVFDRDVEALRASDIVLIVLDGRAVDEGAAFELGFAAALKKTCVGLQTDPRRLVPLGNNPMIQCALQAVFADVDSLMSWVESTFSDAATTIYGTSE